VRRNYLLAYKWAGLCSGAALMPWICYASFELRHPAEHLGILVGIGCFAFAAVLAEIHLRRREQDFLIEALQTGLGVRILIQFALDLFIWDFVVEDLPEVGFGPADAFVTTVYFGAVQVPVVLALGLATRKVWATLTED